MGKEGHVRFALLVAMPLLLCASLTYNSTLYYRVQFRVTEWPSNVTVKRILRRTNFMLSATGLVRFPITVLKSRYVRFFESCANLLWFYFCFLFEGQRNFSRNVYKMATTKRKKVTGDRSSKISACIRNAALCRSCLPLVLAYWRACQNSVSIFPPRSSITFFFVSSRALLCQPAFT